MRIHEGFDRLVNVLAIIDADCPILESLYRILRGGAHCGVGVCFLDKRRLIRGESGLISGIIQRDDSAFESNLAEVLAADLIQRRIRLRDRILHRSLDCFGCLLPIGNG